MLACFNGVITLPPERRFAFLGAGGGGGSAGPASAGGSTAFALPERLHGALPRFVFLVPFPGKNGDITSLPSPGSVFMKVF